MTNTASQLFAHRLNFNGTTDSICLKCFQTIATKDIESELEESEAAHKCGGFELGYTLLVESQKRRSR